MNFRVHLIELGNIIVVTLASIVSLFPSQEHTRDKRELVLSSKESSSTSNQSLQRNLNKHYSNRFITFIQKHPLIEKAFSIRDRKKFQEEISNNFNKGTIRAGFPYN